MGKTKPTTSFHIGATQSVTAQNENQTGTLTSIGALKVVDIIGLAIAVRSLSCVGVSVSMQVLLCFGTARTNRKVDRALLSSVDLMATLFCIVVTSAMLGGFIPSFFANQIGERKRSLGQHHINQCPSQRAIGTCELGDNVALLLKELFVG
jgi:hypothetical protein